MATAKVFFVFIVIPTCNDSAITGAPGFGARTDSYHYAVNAPGFGL